MPYKDPEVARQKSKERQAKYRAKNKEKLRINNLGRYHALYKKDPGLKEKRKEYLKKWKEENKDKYDAYFKNPELKEKARLRAIKWQKENVGRVRANNRMRKKHVKVATPKWVNKQDIFDIYETAAHLERITGIKHHVDHVVPLVNDRVCGLHVPWNLKAIPASENLKKGNKF